MSLQKESEVTVANVSVCTYHMGVDEITYDEFMATRKLKKSCYAKYKISQLRIDYERMVIRYFIIAATETYTLTKKGYYLHRRKSRETIIYTYKIKERQWFKTAYSHNTKQSSSKIGWLNTNLPLTSVVDNNFKAYFKALLSKYITEYEINLECQPAQEFMYRKCGSGDVKDFISMSVANNLGICKTLVKKYNYNLKSLTTDLFPENSEYISNLSSLNYLINNGNIRQINKITAPYFKHVNEIAAMNTSIIDAVYSGNRNYHGDTIYLYIMYNLLTSNGFVLRDGFKFNAMRMLLVFLDEFNAYTLWYNHYSVKIKWQPDLVASNLRMTKYYNKNGDMSVYNHKCTYETHKEFLFINSTKLSEAKLIPKVDIRKLLTDYEIYLNVFIDVRQTLKNLAE